MYISLLSQLERPTKQMREAEQRLKAIPQFCFPDAKDWSPVSDYTRYENSLPHVLPRHCECVRTISPNVTGYPSPIVLYYKSY